MTTAIVPDEPLPAGSSGLSTQQNKPDLEHALDVRIDVKGAYIVEANEQSAESPGEEFKEYLEEYQQDSQDIRLPHQRSVVSHMAVDIGGSLIKLCYWSFEESTQSVGGRLSFVKFPTDRIDACIEFMRRLTIKHRNHRCNSTTEEGSSGDSEEEQDAGDLCVVATGGGAYKFYDRMRGALGVEVMREDEMECLIIGLDFFITQIPKEVFTYSDTNPTSFVDAGSFSYPYLLVNIGSGVSMIKISGPRQFTRVGGTSLGGGTLWGLLSLLTGARNFEEMLRLAEKGDNTAVDMLVGDIYGTDYGKIGLKSTTIASSFGKVYRMKRQAEREAEDHGWLANGDHAHVNAEDSLAGEDAGDGASKGEIFDGSGNSGRSFRPEDISKSLLYAISNNIGQIAYLHAEKHDCQHIFFGGSFIGGHWQTMATLSYAIAFWSKGGKKAYFLRHEGYLGAVGAFLRRQPTTWGRRGSFDSLFPLSRTGSKNQ